MWQSLYEPDLVREYLAGDPTGEVKVAAANADLQKILGSGPAPDVAILRPALRLPSPAKMRAEYLTLPDAE